VATYGLTQSCGGVVYDGLPLPGVTMRISGAGEVELGGRTLMRGYRDGGRGGEDASGTGGTVEGGVERTGAGDVTADGWLRTGDAGWVDDAGRLQIRGRLDDLIVTGGEKVWPGDVEAVLRRHPGIADCAVFARPDPVWGQRVAAAVVPRDPGAPPTLEELRELVGAVLGRHRAPRELVILGSLPRTTLGKVRRGSLEAGGAGSASAAPVDAGAKDDRAADGPGGGPLGDDGRW
jgi:O-succinylbenzoic acid--CoA ligase